MTKEQIERNINDIKEALTGNIETTYSKKQLERYLKHYTEIKGE